MQREITHHRGYDTKRFKKLIEDNNRINEKIGEVARELVKRDWHKFTITFYAKGNKNKMTMHDLSVKTMKS